MNSSINQEFLDRNLLEAVTGGHENRVLKLLRLGANPNLHDSVGTPMVLLADDSHFFVRDRIVDLLLSAGADEGPLLAAAKNDEVIEWPSCRYTRRLGVGFESIDRSSDLDLANWLLTRRK